MSASCLIPSSYFLVKGWDLLCSQQLGASPASALSHAVQFSPLHSTGSPMSCLGELNKQSNSLLQGCFYCTVLGSFPHKSMGCRRSLICVCVIRRGQHRSTAPPAPLHSSSERPILKWLRVMLEGRKYNSL